MSLERLADPQRALPTQLQEADGVARGVARDRAPHRLDNTADPLPDPEVVARRRDGRVALGRVGVGKVMDAGGGALSALGPTRAVVALQVALLRANRRRRPAAVE